MKTKAEERGGWCFVSKREEPDMPLLDEDSSMVNGLGHARFEDQGLEAALQEVLNSEGQDIIELVLALFQEPIAEHTTEESLPFEDPSWVLLIEREEHSRIVPDPAQRILHPP